MVGLGAVLLGLGWWGHMVRGEFSIAVRITVSCSCAQFVSLCAIYKCAS